MKLKLTNEEAIYLHALLDCSRSVPQNESENGFLLASEDIDENHPGHDMDLERADALIFFRLNKMLGLSL